MTDTDFAALMREALAETNGHNGNGNGLAALRTITADSVTMRSIRWLDRPHLQRAAFHLVAGPKGCGKGTWTARTIANLTQGAYGEARDAMIVSTEDSIEIDIVPRLTAAGADLSRVHLVTDEFLLPQDLRRLWMAANERGNIGILVIDPLSAHMAAADANAETAVRHAVGGLNKLADLLDCAVLGIRHFGKSRDNGALSAVLGSTAWVDLPRAVLAFAMDDEDEMVFHVQVVAGNRTGRGNAQSYRIELRDVGLEEPVTYAVAIGDSAKNVDDLLASPRRNSKSAGAREMLLDLLDEQGEQECDDLDARISAQTGVSAKTVRNLRSELKNEGLVRAIPVRDETGAVSRWHVARTHAERPGKVAL